MDDDPIEAVDAIVSEIGNTGTINVTQWTALKAALIVTRSAIAAREAEAARAAADDRAALVEALDDARALADALQGLLDHAGIADAASEDVDPEDEAKERVARRLLEARSRAPAPAGQEG